MSDIFFLLIGIAIGLVMRILVATLDAAIKEIEKDVS